MKNLSKNVNKILGKAGFTLVELLVVMAILGILIAVAIGGISIAQRGARDNTRLRDLNSVKGMLESYYGSKKKYPSALSQCTVGSNIYVAPSDLTCSATSGVSIQQAGFGQNSHTAITTTVTVSSTCAGSDAASSSGWGFAYAPTSGQSTYLLCMLKEDGSPVDLSSQ